MTVSKNLEPQIISEMCLSLANNAGKRRERKKHAKFALRHVPCVGQFSWKGGGVEGGRGGAQTTSGSRPGSRQAAGVHQVAARDSYACPAKCAAYFSQSLRGEGVRGSAVEGAAAPVSFGGCFFLMLFAVMCCKIPLSACFEYSRNISLSCSSHSVLFFLFLYIVFSTTFFFIFFLECEEGGEGVGEVVRQSVVF